MDLLTFMKDSSLKVGGGLCGPPKYFEGVSFLSLNYIKTNQSNLMKFLNKKDFKVLEAFLEACIKIPISF